MTAKNNEHNAAIINRTDKTAFIVIVILAAANFFIGQRGIALGVITGGVIFIADFIAIRLIVNSLIGKTNTVAYNIFLFVIKLLVLLLLIGLLLVFAKLNIYGFIIALTAVVLVIAGSGLKGNKHGTF